MDYFVNSGAFWSDASPCTVNANKTSDVRTVISEFLRTTTPVIGSGKVDPR